MFARHVLAVDSHSAKRHTQQPPLGSAAWAVLISITSQARTIVALLDVAGASRQGCDRGSKSTSRLRSAYRAARLPQPVESSALLIPFQPQCAACGMSKLVVHSRKPSLITDYRQMLERQRGHRRRALFALDHMPPRLPWRP